MSSPATESASPGPYERPVAIVGVISVGHFLSHFYYLVLPPLFPLMKEGLGVDYTSLGLAITALSAMSAIAQAPVGFIVDRYDPPSVLLVGLVLSSLAIMCVGLFPHYGALIACMFVFGLGDSVFHPADFTILTRSINPIQMGRAFSVHAFAGHLGFAAAPVTTIALASWFGWQTALVIFGLAGLLIAAVIFCFRPLLSRPCPVVTHAADNDPYNRRGGLSLLFSLPLLMGLLLFMGFAMSGSGVRDFGVATLHVLYDAPLEQAGIVISAFLFAAPVGVLIGGWISDRTYRYDLIVVSGLVVLAASVFVVAAAQPSLPVVALLFGVAGLFSGAIATARDMLIRALTPARDMGKAFGFVSIGLSAGGIVAPVLLGYLLDHTHPSSVFWVTGVFSLLTVPIVLATGRLRHAARGPAQSVQAGR